MTTDKPGKSIIGFDMDGVLIDHLKNKLALAANYGILLQPEETHSEILFQKLAIEDFVAFQNELYGDTPFALSAPVMEGAILVLRALRSAEVPMVLISQRYDPAVAVKLLQTSGLWGEFFDERNAFFVRKSEEKNLIGKREGVTHYFDDQRRVLLVMPDIKKKFLVDTFQQFEDNEAFVRLFDWAMIHREIIPGVK